MAPAAPRRAALSSQLVLNYDATASCSPRRWNGLNEINLRSKFNPFPLRTTSPSSRIYAWYNYILGTFLARSIILLNPSKRLIFTVSKFSTPWKEKRTIDFPTLSRACEADPNQSKIRKVTGSKEIEGSYYHIYIYTHNPGRWRSIKMGWRKSRGVDRARNWGREGGGNGWFVTTR